MSNSAYRSFKKISSALKKFAARKRSIHRRLRQRETLRHFESLESRQLMALDILSLSPADGAIDWTLDTNLVITFNSNVVKGQGAINVVRDSTDTLGFTGPVESRVVTAIDVNSPNVTISGAVVTIDIPINLEANESYYIKIDNGAFLDTTTVQTQKATLLTQDFEVLPLDPFIGESGGDGTDYTLTPPISYSVDNTKMATGGVPEWRGWSFADKLSWIRQAGSQSRDAFSLASGTIAVGDPDEFDDASNSGEFNSTFISRPISLVGVEPNTAVLEFDSSFRPEDSQVGKLQVRFDNGDWEDLLVLNPTNTSNDAISPTFFNANLNERLRTGGETGISTDGKGGVPIRAVQNPVGATSMEFRWNVVGANDWWWAIDNILVTGTVTGMPFSGIIDDTTWNLSIPELTLTIDAAEMNENGGVATATVSRNGPPTADLIVSLASNDTSEANVPSTVIIPAGKSSITFPITAVDDLLVDRTQTVTITANAPTFTQGLSTIDVIDDEGPKIVSLSPADNATDVAFNSNLVMTLDVNVRKGSGLIYIVRSSDNVTATIIDVNSSAVTLSGSGGALTSNIVTINPPINLNGLTEYHVRIDDGTFVDTSATPTPAAILLTQNFNLIPLSPFTSGSGGDGTDFTRTPPPGYAIDNSAMVGGNPSSDFFGWNISDKQSWLAVTGGGLRSSFTLGQGSLAVAEPAQAGLTGGRSAFNSYFETPSISLDGIAAGSVAIEFDVSFQAGLPRLGVMDVSYDGGLNWTTVLQFDNESVLNGKFTVSSTGVIGTGANVLGTLNNPTSGNLKFGFGLLNGRSGWMAIDNLKITGGITGLPFQGISNPTTWSFTTGIAPTVTVTIDRTSMNENGGTAVGTVTRNPSSPTSPEIIVSLASSDTSEATVPATVTIPAGASFATFPITAVDDTIGDGNQTAKISATFGDFFSFPASITVQDDDFPKVTTLSPPDNSTAVPVSSNLVITFDQPIKKGNGFVHIIRASDNKAEVSIDIRSAAVTIAGNVLTINPPNNLKALTDYYVAFEDGAILNTVSTIKTGSVLLSQDFELQTLNRAVFETAGLTPDGRDFTLTPPSGWSVDNSAMPAGGVPEWSGWSFASKSFWETQGGQGRVNFTRASGTIAVGEPDEWDDTFTPNNLFNSTIHTSPINLDSVQQETVLLEFDSSFRPEDSQVGKLDVTFDGGLSWANLLTLDPTNTSNAGTAANINERFAINVPNPGIGLMQFRWNVVGANDWWWAIDNIRVTGNTLGLTSPGIANTDSTTWNFTTADTPTLSVSIANPVVGENVGTVTGTVTRNLGTTGDVIVALSSSDTSVATVPATVTIPSGSASANFTVAVVDDALADGLRNVAIAASNVGFVGGSASLAVNDDEVANVIITEIMFNPSGRVSNPANPTSEDSRLEYRTEWLEVYNRGTIPADLSGWSFDDEDNTNWGAIPNGVVLGPGAVAVIYNGFFNLNTEAIFRTEWAIPSTIQVIGIPWGNLENGPSAVSPINENLTLIDAGKTVVNRVNYDDDGTVWPPAAPNTGNGGLSIYLLDTNTDNNVGTNWRRSVAGTDGAYAALGPTYNSANIGSPGIVPANSPVAPKVSGVVFGDGTAQRSMVTSIQVNFDSLMTIDPNAFQLEVSPIGGGAFAPVAFTISQTPSIVDGKTVVTLAFSGTGVVGNSLPDGNYKLTAIAANIRSQNSGLALDGNNDGSAGGDFVDGESAADNFFRLFGDSDGNGVINPLETNRYRATVGKVLGDPAYNPLFDFDGSGGVTPADTNAYRQRVGRSRGF